MYEKCYAISFQRQICSQRVNFHWGKEYVWIYALYNIDFMHYSDGGGKNMLHLLINTEAKVINKILGNNGLK